MWFSNDANNQQAVQTVIAGLLCPSDGFGGPLLTISVSRGTRDAQWARLNYFGVFGGLQNDDLMSTDPTKWGVFDGNRVTTIAQIHDGTSNTMCIAESLTGPVGYARGFLWSDQVCGAFIFTELYAQQPVA